MNWQPIDTAPKDESVFLGYWPGRICFAWWDDENECWLEYYGGECAEERELTHWMPLPQPPEEMLN